MTDILIVGAGASGLTLAIELLRRGVDIRIIDAAEGPFGGSRGKGIQPRSLEIFDMMGVVDDVLANSSLYQPLKAHLGPITKVLASLGTNHEPTEDRPHPNMMMVPQFCTEAALRNQVKKLGGKIEYGIGLVSIDDKNGSVTASLSDGSSVTARYLAGCDGGRSTVRNAIGLSLVGETLDDKTMVVADMELEGLDRDFWHVWPLSKGGPTAFAPLPLPNMWQLQAPEAIAKGGLEKGIFKKLKIKPKRIVWQSAFKHQIRMVEKYRVRNVFLVGDAAHIHPPSGAQGLNTGVQDAFNLGWKLISALRTGEDAILDTYEAERLPIAANMLNLTSKLHIKASTDRGELTNQLSVGYLDSSLSLGEGSGELQPGDRMPGVRLQGGINLLDAMRDGNALKISRSNAPDILVRPDGYIAEFTDEDILTYHGFEVRQVAV